MNFKKILLGVLCLGLASSAWGDPQKLYDEAVELYANRTDAASVDRALDLLNTLASESPAPELAYRGNILKSQLRYWKGMKAEGRDGKMDQFQEAMDAATQAKALLPQYAESYYYHAIARGRWAEAKGIIASLKFKGELLDNAETAKTKQTLKGESGETVDYYGPDRTLGRVLFKLPAFAGGSRSQALDHLKVAYEKGAANALNAVYYAEILAAGNGDEQIEACKVLADLLSHDPQTYNPDRVPETVEEFADAQKLNQELCL